MPKTVDNLICGSGPSLDFQICISNIPESGGGGAVVLNREAECGLPGSQKSFQMKPEGSSSYIQEIVVHPSTTGLELEVSQICWF